MVNIADLNKADVLAALYNASQPHNMGFLQAGRGPMVMDRGYASGLLRLGADASGDYPVGASSFSGRSPLFFDHLYGRPLKVDLSSDVSFEPAGFDRDNGGEGAAQKVIDHLRETRDVGRADGTSFADYTMTEEESMMFLVSLLQER